MIDDVIKSVPLRGCELKSTSSGWGVYNIDVSPLAGL